MQIEDTLDGPDFLMAVADAEAAQGNSVNAAEYRRRAIQWKSDRLVLTEAQHRVGELETALARIQQIAA